MFESIFSSDNLFHLIEILFWLIGAFAIGMFFGYLMGKSKKSTSKQEQFTNDFENLNTEDYTTSIRAKKTFERGGILSEEKKDTGKLDFKTIGTTSIEMKDNLQKINGIGQTAESKLNDAGIYTYEQISNLNSNDIEKLTQIINFFPGRIAKDDWIGQAIKLVNKKN